MLLRDLQHFFQKWKHFVPVDFDLQNLEHQIRWAKAHDAEARAIAEAARERALKLFSPHYMACFVYSSLRHYHDMMARPIDAPPPGAKTLDHLCKKGKFCGHLHADFNREQHR